jgi:hypothetical protein
MLAPYPTDRLHNQHPPPPASRQSRQSNKPEIGGSILDAETQRLVRLIQPNVRLTTHHLGKTMKPLTVVSVRLTTVMVIRLAS